MKIKHSTFEDERGSFTPISCTLFDMEWDQFNISTNDKKFTFRGLHYQTDPYQTKCVKVISGKVLDIWFDLNTKEVQSFRLDSSEFLFVSPNYAHGFLTLEDNTIVTYLVKGRYDSESEHSIVWNEIEDVKRLVETYIGDKQLIISEKDVLGK